MTYRRTYRRQNSNNTQYDSGNPRHGPKERVRRVAQKVEENFNFSASCLLFAGIVVGAITNLNALHSTASEVLADKLAPTYTLGGLLIHPTFSGISQLAAGLLFIWFVFLRKAKKNFIDWLIVVGLVAVLGMGSSGVAAQAHWSASFFVWVVLQGFQFFGIFSSNPALKTAAVLTYALEYSFQCHATPISDMGIVEMYEAVKASDFQVGDIFWGMAIANLFCMLSVEWLTKALVVINKKRG